MLRPSTAVPALLLTVAIGAAAPACASGRYYQRSSNQRDYRDSERLAYDNGYRQGFSHGQRDAGDRRGYRIDRDRDYRNADSGYRYGDRGDYRRLYRSGYEAGYPEGYNRVARSVRNDPGRIYSPVNGARIGNVYGSPAAQVGYRDGLEAGRDDARDRQRNDPRRSKRYREGDHDYNSRYGTLDQYKQDTARHSSRGTSRRNLEQPALIQAVGIGELVTSQCHS